ncbi:Uncharacterised protein [Pannonibacter phragmitetus]|uniref:Uncharacterized protein n=1 Tax=Pannonibacter phragmitetus TaxID=121719 RepID=A0A378ZRG7_9HYPH|nr:hypothetical protein [Pannonibacter phragmitetus]SUA99856.1 Uncharacterised protein [Pannonibacter phragmitetus]
MSLTDVLKDQSTWTYNIMKASSNLGEVIREDAITSVNLAVINDQSTAQNLGLGTTSLQGAKLEIEFGGDWIWNYKGSVLLVQAKKLDVVNKFPYYTIDINQMNTLIATTKNGYFGTSPAIPFYVFYNSFADENPADFGCTMIHATTLQSMLVQTGQINQKTAQVSPSQMQTAGWAPWWKIFT